MGLIFDPGGDAEQIVSACGALGVTPTAVLLTHGHFDHVGALAALLDGCGALGVYCHGADLAELDHRLFPLSAQLGSRAPNLISDGQALDLAGLRVEVLHTPGHTEGSCCFRVGEALFTGDTLFRGSVGRTDLPGGDGGKLRASLGRLAALEGELTVYPGHDEATTLAAERRENPYLRGLVP